MVNVGLKDEYEGYDHPGNTTLPDSESETDTAQQAPNLDHYYRLIGSSSQIDPGEISWNLHRITLASVLYDDAAYDTAGDKRHMVVLPVGEGVKWTQVWQEGKEVFLWNGKFRGNGYERMGPLTIVQDPVADLLLLEGGDAAHASTFKKGHLLYLPHYDDDGEPKGLIDGPVYNRMASTGQPLHEKDTSDCSVPEHDEAYPGSIPGYRMPRNHPDVIGLYEGGGTWNCKVYRPAGHCKMRSERYWHDEWFLLFGFRLFLWKEGGSEREAGEFCFVCKFHLVTLLDPTKHELLDKEYPERC